MKVGDEGELKSGYFTDISVMELEYVCKCICADLYMYSK